MMPKEYIEQYKEYLTQRNIKQQTINNYLRVARRYTNFLNTKGINIFSAEKTDIYIYLSTRSKQKSSTYNKELKQLKFYLHWLSETENFKIDLNQLRNKSEPHRLPKNISVRDLHILCTPTKEERRCSNHLSFIREQAIIEFMVSTGVRQIELREAKIGQLSRNLNACLIPGYKGGRQRMVYLGKPAREALIAWLLRRDIPLNLAGCANQYLFISNHGSPMHPTSIIRLVRKLALRRLGYVVTPHMLRHTFATEMLRATGSLRMVQEMLGHVFIKTTEIYCGLDLNDHRHAIHTFHPHGGEIGEFSETE